MKKRRVKMCTAGEKPDLRVATRVKKRRVKMCTAGEKADLCMATRVRKSEKEKG